MAGTGGWKGESRAGAQAAAVPTQLLLDFACEHAMCTWCPKAFWGVGNTEPTGDGSTSGHMQAQEHPRSAEQISLITGPRPQVPESLGQKEPRTGGTWRILYTPGRCLHCWAPGSTVGARGSGLSPTCPSWERECVCQHGRASSPYTPGETSDLHSAEGSEPWGCPGLLEAHP